MSEFPCSEIEQRQIALGERLIERGLGLLLLRVDDIELALCSLERCPCPALRRPGFLMVRVGLLETLTGSELVIAQCSIAIEVVFGAGQLGGSAAHVGRGLFDHRLVHAPVGVDIGEGCPLGRNARLSAGELGAVIPILQLQQQVARLDGLVIRDRDRSR